MVAIEEVPAAVKRMTMMSSAENFLRARSVPCSPVKPRKAREKCPRCEEWQRKFREQNVNYFRERDHTSHAIKKLLSRCAELMSATLYQQLEASLQLNVRFFTEHGVTDVDFPDETSSPRSPGGGKSKKGGLDSSLQERLSQLEKENEMLLKEKEELEANFRKAEGQLNRNRLLQRTISATGDTVQRVEVECQTERPMRPGRRTSSKDGGDFSPASGAPSWEDFDEFDNEPAAMVKRELDKTTSSRNAMAGKLKALEGDMKAVVSERDKLEKKVRELQAALDRKLNAVVPGIQVPGMPAAVMAKMRKKGNLKAGEVPTDPAAYAQYVQMVAEAGGDVSRMSFDEQVAHSDAQVQRILIGDAQGLDPNMVAEYYAAGTGSPGGGHRGGPGVGPGGDGSPGGGRGSSASPSGRRRQSGRQSQSSRQSGGSFSPGSTGGWAGSQGGGAAGAKGGFFAQGGGRLQEDSAEESTKFYPECHVEVQTELETADAETQVKEWDIDGGGGVRLRANQLAGDQENTRKGKAFGKSLRDTPKLGLAGGMSKTAPAATSATASTPSGQDSPMERTQRLPPVPKPVQTPMQAAPTPSPIDSASTQGAPYQGDAKQEKLDRSRSLTASAGFLPSVPASSPPTMSPSRSVNDLRKTPPTVEGGGPPRRRRLIRSKEPEPYLLEVWEKYPDSHRKPSDTELVHLGAAKPTPADSGRSSSASLGQGSRPVEH